MNEATYWRQRYEMLRATFSEAVNSAIDASITPRLLADKEAYELGRLHGATEEREACAKVCENIGHYDENVDDYYSDTYASAVRARSHA